LRSHFDRKYLGNRTVTILLTLPKCPSQEHLADEGIENVNTASNGKGCAIVCCSNTYYNVKGKQQLSFSGFHTIYKGINSFAYYDLANGEMMFSVCKFLCHFHGIVLSCSMPLFYFVQPSLCWCFSFAYYWCL
jgi:hypothetical protein